MEKEQVEVFEIDDDFDPLEDTGIELEEEEYAGGIEYQVPVIPDADKSVVPEKVQLPAAQRIDNLIKGLPGQKFRILEGIKVCDEPKTLEEASDQLEEKFPQMASVYTAARIIELLADAGALDRIEPEEPEGEAAPEPVEGTNAGAVEGADTAETAASTVSADPAAPAAPVDPAAPAAADRVESITWDDVDAATDFEEVEQAAPVLYVATDAGREAVEARWSANVAAKVVADEPRYLPIWKQVLELCSAEGGATKKYIESQVDSDPLLQKPRRWCQYFLGKYKDVNALTWDQTWQITEIGRDLLESDLFEGVASVHPASEAHAEKLSA